MKKSLKVIMTLNATVCALLLVQGCVDSPTLWDNNRSSQQQRGSEPSGWTGGGQHTDEWQTSGNQQSTGREVESSTPRSTSVSTYTVVNGDTLGEIAQRHGVTTRELANHNNLSNPNSLRVGQVLEIPAATRTPSRSGSTGSPSTSRGGSTARQPLPSDGKYTVQSGDFPGSIAQKFGIKTDDLMAANPQVTDPKKLRIGQVLTIPGGGSAPDPVEPAPTITSTSTSTSTGSARRPTSTSSTESADMWGSGTSSTSTTPTTSTTAKAGERTYTVREGDDVYSVAVRMGVSPTEIRQLNGLSTSELTPGTTIRIPAASRP